MIRTNPNNKHHIPFQDVELSEMVVKDDTIQSYIFAPDKKTGIPRSDLAILYSNDTSQEVAEYIKRNLLRPVPSHSSTDDPDLAIATMRRRGETVEDYGERLRDVVKINDNDKDKDYE